MFWPLVRYRCWGPADMILMEHDDVVLTIKR
ncbi:hypothetical protein O9992_00730 [Vibrio lentus]|nr:hypothetical protein [Vibrio lentus]